MIKNVIAVAALCSVLPAFAATNLVTDGSFESAVVASGKYADYTGTSLSGWTVAAGDVLEIRNAEVGTAFDGSNFAELDSTHNSTISQTVATTAGDTYTLSFYYSARAKNAYNTGFAGGVVSAASNGLSVDFGTGAIDLTSAANTTSNNIWTLYSTTFVATGSSTTLTFAATGASDTFGSALDDISLISSVPEPGTLAMMGAGILGLFGLSRRRSR